MQNVQVLTKADIINNMILLLLVFNILVVTLQHSKKYNIPFLENNDNAIKISVISLSSTQYNINFRILFFHF